MIRSAASFLSGRRGGYNAGKRSSQVRRPFLCPRLRGSTKLLERRAFPLSTPAKAGVQPCADRNWAPAFAGADHIFRTSFRISYPALFGRRGCVLSAVLRHGLPYGNAAFFDLGTVTPAQRISHARRLPQHDITRLNRASAPPHLPQRTFGLDLRRFCCISEPLFENRANGDAADEGAGAGQARA